jgi:hypothetical protein
MGIKYPGKRRVQGSRLKAMTIASGIPEFEPSSAE